MESEPFEYSPVSESTDEIRLLELQPHDPHSGGRIECSIRSVKLSSKPKYEALSYAWGTTGADYPVPISLDRRKRFIGRNLYLALDHLRLVGQPRTLWVDALCINQNDSLERNHQVTQMGSIYSQADQVLMWLGSEVENSGKAMAFLRKIGAGPSLPSFQEIQSSKAGCNAMESFYAAPYWTRLWIKQEAVLASRLVIVWGTDTLRWEEWDSVIRKISWFASRGKSKHSEMTGLDASLPARLSAQRVEYSIRGSMPLLDLVQAFSESNCQDSRDRFFGVLSMSERCCRDHVLVNYTKSLLELCTAAVFHHVHHHQRGVPPIDYLQLQCRMWEAVSGFTPLPVPVKGNNDCLLNTIIHTSPITSWYRPQMNSRNEAIKPRIYFHNRQISYLVSVRKYMDGFLGNGTSYESALSDLIKAKQRLWLDPRAVERYIEMLYHVLETQPERYILPSQAQVIVDNVGMIAVVPNTVMIGDIIRSSDDFSRMRIVRRNPDSESGLQEIVTADLLPSEPSILEEFEEDRSYYEVDFDSLSRLHGPMRSHFIFAQKASGVAEPLDRSPTEISRARADDTSNLPLITP